MPTFRITAPDGTQYNVTGPEGATEEQALDQVKAQHGQAAASETSSSSSSSSAPEAPDQPPGMLGRAEEFGKGLVRGTEHVAGDIGAALVGFPKDVANLASGHLHREHPELEYGEDIAKATGMERSPDERLHAAGTLGEVLSPANVLGKGSAALKLGTGILTAAGSELGRATGIPGAELVGGIAGGATGGKIAAERGSSRLAAELPNAEQQKAAATAGYDFLQKSNAQISPSGVNELLTRVKTMLRDDQFPEHLAPSTNRSVELFDTETANAPATISKIDSFRQLLRNTPVGNEKDYLASNRAIRVIDDYLSSIPDDHILSGSPKTDAAVLRHAQGQWAAHKRLEDIATASEQAGLRAGGSGAGDNIINAKRQEIKKLLNEWKKNGGVPPEIADKAREIVEGTTATNTTRRISKFSPNTSVSSLAGLGASSVFGPGVGATLAGLGVLGRLIGPYLTSRQIKQLEDMVKESSPIGKPIAASQAAEKSDLGRLTSSSAARSALTSPLAPGQ